MASSSRKKFSFNKKETEPVARPSTPTMASKYCNNEEHSPLFVPCTQEVRENMDVLWDWNSPQSKPKYSRKKRVIKVPSPKLPVKKVPSSNKFNIIDKLKKELLSDVEDIGLDDRDLEFNDLSNDDDINKYFNDSFDEDLLIISQQIESKFANDASTKNATFVPEKPNNESPRKLLHKSFSSTALEQSPVRHSNKKPFKSKMPENFDFDDSLDSALSEFNEDKLLPPLPEVKKEETSDINKSPLKLKTKSLSFSDHYDSTRDNMQKALDDKVRAEIERKRQIALAKLNAKKKNLDDISPMKCSPDEIEEKRKQALAKLEARKRQEVIERNRQEALKRLHISRQKRAFNGTINKK